MFFELFQGNGAWFYKTCIFEIFGNLIFYQILIRCDKQLASIYKGVSKMDPIRILHPVINPLCCEPITYLCNYGIGIERGDIPIVKRPNQGRYQARAIRLLSHLINSFSNNDNRCNKGKINIRCVIRDCLIFNILNTFKKDTGIKKGRLYHLIDLSLRIFSSNSSFVTTKEMRPPRPTPSPYGNIPRWYGLPIFSLGSGSASMNCKEGE